MQSQTKIFSRLVKDYMTPAPVVLKATSTVAEAIVRMDEEKASSVLVVDVDGHLAGILTERDVTARIALRCTGGEPLEDLMTSPVHAIGADDYLYYAIARMRRLGWRHMPVVDGDWHPVGIIDLQDALCVAAYQTVRLIEKVSHEGTLDGFREIKAAQVELADSLFRDNVPAPEIQSLITHINRDIHRRVIEAHVLAMRERGWGDPPVSFAVIIMGSGGRGENFLYPDQDNGFILEDYPDREHQRIDAFFIELAERMTRDLDAIGFPLCRGFVMATNPLWRKTRSQWRDQMRYWGRKRGFVTLRLADIFFDFRGVYGQAAFARELRSHVTSLLKSSPAFLQEIAREVSQYGVALGWFGRLLTEKEKPEHKGKLDLKYAGILPLVSNIRLLALREGLAEASTLERIDTLRDAGVLDKHEADYLAGAFAFITGLLLRQQIDDFKAGREVGNHVHPDNLSEREQDILVDSLKAIDALRQRIRGEFTAEIF